MSDLSDLHGIFPDSLRWNAETGTLGVATYNAEAGERELRDILLGSAAATFVMDLATRERGYGLIKQGVYDMKLTPVDSPVPPWPGDDAEYKPALGCWVWNPQLGELRLETNAAILREAISSLWDRAKFAQEAIDGLQPVIRFVDRVDVPIKAVGKTFYGPIIQIVAWIERNLVPGWKERTPTVPPPKAPPLLAASSTPAPVVMAPSRAKLKPPRGAAKPGPGKPGSDKPGPDDPIDDILGGDSIPLK
jgi:hypothetical protein